ncbi:hypothetical protein E3P92_02933 [Wallemia ichthyophaga]|uniref:Exosome complex component rrp45 n=2 Tax=Wallemia ichthyophaga TaxID=245174 RepID=A0A4T0G8V5_WALIC|nr:Exosome complex component rrp45 [Wallemia ichthyophaga EXF-994]TIA70821.1 hypothetical protein E3P91_02889 [Wallemia ichthyophaga]EOR00241.1 Exosome complex component rrp45 [Wallemia ichthyophaga EXF-994]TIA97752.1 hypothetical protein E3P95_02709 [Wallemia ichthyophaga]TIA98921.1 hypothetical protein E3P94_02760 [Wallemia ichthyophaga]TIB10690.1 hypothetical protein E3P90_02763 [Wallemia ichthyophaga]
MPRKLEVNVNNKEFIINALKDNKRLDGRSLLEARRLELEYGEGLGSVTVKLGESKVMCSVSCTVTSPLPERPYEGQMSISSELSAMAMAHYESGLRGNTAEEEATLNRQLDKAIRRSGMVDREALCIVGGEKVWSIALTLHYMADDGNLVDAGVTACTAALLHFRKPEATVVGGEVTYHPLDERTPVPLAINHTPISFTFAFLDTQDTQDTQGGGDIAVLDPNAIEAQLSDACFMVTTTPQKELLTLNKQGGKVLSVERVLECVGYATERAHTLAKQIHDSVNADLDRRRIGGIV